MGEEALTELGARVTRIADEVRALEFEVESLREQLRALSSQVAEHMNVEPD